MTRRATTVTASVLAAVLALSACGETIDLRDTAPDTAPDAAPDAAPDDVGTGGADVVAADADLPLDGDLDELLAALLASWRGLDQRVIDGDTAEPMARIETTWAAAEPLVRADHPTSLFGMQQAMDLARSAVDRRRPADASKGYRLAIELTDEILSR